MTKRNESREVVQTNAVARSKSKWPTVYYIS